MPTRLLRLREVLERTGLSRSTLYELIKKDKFPKQILISERCVGWIEDDVHDFILQRLEVARRVKNVA